jgi:hypothetical protein
MLLMKKESSPGLTALAALVERVTDWAFVSSRAVSAISGRNPDHCAEELL